MIKVTATPEQLVEDVFDRGAPAYPAFPGSAPSETSRAAANEICWFARGIRGKIARRLFDISPNGETPDEAAAALNISILTSRPRFTELATAGLIEKTGERRPTRGLVARMRREQFKAEVWRASSLLMSCEGSLQGRE